MGPAGGKRIGDAICSRAVLKCIAYDGGREQKQRPSKDDRHHTGVIHFQRHVLRLAAVHFAAHHPLGILNGDLSYPLRDRDHRGNDDDQEQH